MRASMKPCSLYRLFRTVLRDATPGTSSSTFSSSAVSPPAYYWAPIELVHVVPPAVVAQAVVVPVELHPDEVAAGALLIDVISLMIFLKRLMTGTT
jgi:hypothetical protein